MSIEVDRGLELEKEWAKSEEPIFLPISEIEVIELRKECQERNCTKYRDEPPYFDDCINESCFQFWILGHYLVYSQQLARNKGRLKYDL